MYFPPSPCLLLMYMFHLVCVAPLTVFWGLRSLLCAASSLYLLNLYVAHLFRTLIAPGCHGFRIWSFARHRCNKKKEITKYIVYARKRSFDLRRQEVPTAHLLLHLMQHIRCLYQPHILFHSLPLWFIRYQWRDLPFNARGPWLSYPVESPGPIC